jgi:hypothetical protein
VCAVKKKKKKKKSHFQKMNQQPQLSTGTGKPFPDDWAENYQSMWEHLKGTCSGGGGSKKSNRPRRKTTGCHVDDDENLLEGFDEDDEEENEESRDKDNSYEDDGDSSVEGTQAVEIERGRQRERQNKSIGTKSPSKQIQARPKTISTSQPTLSTKNGYEQPKENLKQKSEREVNFDLSVTDPAAMQLANVIQTKIQSNFDLVNYFTIPKPPRLNTVGLSTVQKLKMIRKSLQIFFFHPLCLLPNNRGLFGETVL